MTRLSFFAASVLALVVAGCADSGSPPTVPSASTSLADRSSSGAKPTADPNDGDDAHRDGARVVRMRDACDPTTFNAALRDPNACVGNGHVIFDRFVAELTRTRQAAQWRFDPPKVELDRHDNLIAVNRGGEVHTFTRDRKSVV